MSHTGHSDRMVTGSRTLDAGAAVEAHRHAEHQIVYASRGVLEVSTHAGSWMAPANRAIWIPAGEVHEHRAYGPTTLHAVGLPLRANPLRLSGPSVLYVGPLLRELLIAYTERPHEDSATRRRLRAVLLDELRAARQKAIHLPAATDPRLAAVCSILAADPADPRSLAQLAAASGAGQRTLTRLFAQEFGMSFPQWRTQLRLHLALRLLAEGTSVTATGHRCGWATTSAFVDVFHRQMGYTPGRGRSERNAQTSGA